MMVFKLCPIPSPPSPSRPHASKSLFVVRAGSDTVVIPPTDPNFCEDCTYFIGVAAASNSTYTILVTYEEEGGQSVCVNIR